MGTIIKPKRKDGSTKWLAHIAIRRLGKTVFRENRTFERRGLARETREKLGETRRVGGLPRRRPQTP